MRKAFDHLDLQEAYQESPRGAWNWPTLLSAGNGRRLWNTEPQSGKLASSPLKPAATAAALVMVELSSERTFGSVRSPSPCAASVAGLTAS